MAKARIKVPSSAKKGEIFEIKTLMSHNMETGRRKDKKTGELIPRKIINKFECVYNGKTVFSADFHPSISANPYLAFSCRATESGKLEFRWTEDGGAVTSETKEIQVS
ncbi:MAG: thiosulfate oxidation carrier complex protein SoxZ [Rhodospirillales bacterium]|nr:thiosulfate oxidation carrier complex protein SoxZ [Rhodospirillales bacterium]MCW8863121.1 thiosulfate oxidation carrier complex protein SoxZ [Rhodospirillales bacterium]MCW8952771.1 thiosulfate oxidation carrier complex protein SoxZ [Rhodospirillales bacterium]MCW9001730.1 thiosulfate oxidation carrier complex protein SoxZ [Rhodospirillales bacterium]